MSKLEWILILTSIAGVGSTGLGGLIGALFNKESKKTISILLSFAGGVMLSVVCFDLIYGAIFPETSNEKISVLIIILGIFVGFYSVYVLNYFIDSYANEKVSKNDLYQCSKKRNSSKQLLIAGIVMSIAISLHNFPEGMIIGASFANSGANEEFSRSGLMLSFVIGLHDVPEGMAVTVPLIAGGMGKIKAVIISALTGIPTMIGAILGYYIGMISPVSLSLSLSFASGAMLYVIFGELIPESNKMCETKHPAFLTLFGMFIGMIIIFI